MKTIIKSITCLLLLATMSLAEMKAATPTFLKDSYLSASLTIETKLHPAIVENPNYNFIGEGISLEAGKWFFKHSVGMAVNYRIAVYQNLQESDEAVTNFLTGQLLWSPLNTFGNDYYSKKWDWNIILIGGVRLTPRGTFHEVGLVNAFEYKINDRLSPYGQIGIVSMGEPNNLGCIPGFNNLFLSVGIRYYFR